jgi:hypothetical protein
MRENQIGDPYSIHVTTSLTASACIVPDRSLSGLLRLDVCGPDHLAPLFGFVGDELTEVGGRLGERRGAQVGQARLDVGIRKTRIDIPVQLVDDLGRCVSGYGNAVPVKRPGRRTSNFSL